MHDARPARFIGTALFACSALFSVPAFAQIDFSGQWAVRYHEDQQERAPGGTRQPTKGYRLAYSTSATSASASGQAVLR